MQKLKGFIKHLAVKFLTAMFESHIESLNRPVKKSKPFLTIKIRL